MVITPTPVPIIGPASGRRPRRLWHDEHSNTPSLGCIQCPDRSICGGLRVETALFDCLEYCCRVPAGCDRVCRNHPDFADRVREVGTFSLADVPRAAILDAPDLPAIVPVLFHGRRRATNLRHNAVAVSLYRMFDRRHGTTRFSSHAALCREYTIEEGTQIVLTGAARDAPLERWWSLGPRRRELIRAFRAAGAVLVAVPNFSLFTDVPRWTDLHAIKRIALVHHEFLDEGLPAALHVNGRTEADFERWATFVSARPEITHLAYEFATGTGWETRMEQHTTWLCAVASAAGRPLDLVLRGGQDVKLRLGRHFGRVIELNTDIFMKTMMRRRAVGEAGTRLSWEPSPTLPGMPLDDLLEDNIAMVGGLVRAPQ